MRTPEQIREYQRTYYLKNRDKLLERSKIQKHRRSTAIHKNYSAETRRFYGAKHPLRAVWNHIKQRCYNPKCKAYPRYGGRGISMDEKWRNSFIAFCKDVETGYQKGLQLDRINNDMGYFANNVRWATPKQQQNNRSTNVIIRHNGVAHTLSEWSEITGVSRFTLNRRVRQNGWTFAKAVATPVRRRSG
jgi:hypothetical protein